MPRRWSGFSARACAEVTTPAENSDNSLVQSPVSLSPRAGISSAWCMESMEKPYLEKYTYSPADGVHWQVPPGPKGSGPELQFTVVGHEGLEGHTFYLVECSMRCGYFWVRWHAPRRLVHLREGLHGPLKKALGRARYAQRFAGSRFASRGGFPGTTARLRGWLEALSVCINTGGCSPSQVAFILRFLDPPEPSSCEDLACDETAPLTKRPLTVMLRQLSKARL
mmetsp:Transcript_3737/g.9674  ORF Transcript_3737/g.9674 Transcript_3737/m.9674 type:complete len:224 (-) Transcript_3737:177-848(-)